MKNMKRTKDSYIRQQHPNVNIEIELECQLSNYLKINSVYISYYSGLNSYKIFSNLYISKYSKALYCPFYFRNKKVIIV